MTSSFQQLGIPKDRPDSLCAVGQCQCGGFSLHGQTIESIKTTFGEMGKCPICHQNL